MPISRRHFFPHLLNAVASRAAETLRTSQFSEEQEKGPEKKPSTHEEEGITAPHAGAMIPRSGTRGMCEDELPLHLRNSKS